jgi:U3 small nucleolar RNA-associated protein MPP10
MATTTIQPTSSLTSLLDSPFHFLQPTSAHQTAATSTVKSLLDPLASQIVAAQTARRTENKRKRKRGSDDVEDPILQLRSIYTNGLAVKQVWEQARRVLDAACAEVERGLDEYAEKYGEDEDEDGVEDEDMMGSMEEMDEVDSEEGGMDLDEMEDMIEDAEDEGQDEEDIENDLDAEELNGLSEDDDLKERPQATYKPDPNNLNDGFFSIDDFNKQSQFLEQMDARGDDDNPSDEDEVDWEADPLAQPLPKATASGSSRRAERVEETESEDEEGGPTFGNADLNAADSDEEADDEDINGGDLDGTMFGLNNTNDIRYADFFEPPPRKPSKLKKMRALPKTQPPLEAAVINGDDNEEEADLERAMADVRRDLLDSDDEAEEEEEEDDDEDLSDEDRLPRLSTSKLRDKNLSTHEKQRLQIAEEIKRLEAINVSKKPWQQAGEASAQARPMNSLIEEDLEFERTGKPVPVITAEVTTDLEALIKRRILARDFDEVVRRNPTTLDSAADARRGRSKFEVDDQKPMQGLGEIYEEQYQKNADPTTYVDKRSAATKKQHAEIEKLWKEVRDQLDVLANLHIKPKRAEVEIKTVEDKPRIAMEDAQPAASGDLEDGTMLAPQEIYKPGTDSRANEGEVLNAKSGVSRNKEELSREEKTRKRRREKERQKKAGTNQPSRDSAIKTGKAKKQVEQEQVLKDLQKGGAKVIGKNGQVQELSNKKKGRSEAVDTSQFSGGALKL